MYRNLLILLLATIALVCAQSSTRTSNSDINEDKNSTSTLAPSSTNGTVSPTTKTTESQKTTIPTTTPKPNTTTTAKPTPAPTPSPVPKPEQWNGKVNDSQTNTTCISVQFSVQIKFKYNGTETKELTTGFTIPANASVDSKDSYCSPKNETKEEIIAIRFDDWEHTNANLTLKFNKTDNSVSVEEIDLSFKATKELMPQIEPKLEGKILKASKSGLNLFKVASVHSYVCSAVQSASLESSEDVISDVQIEFTNSKVEAYMTESSKGNFDSEIDCKSSDISDVVPIAVGAALAGLVVIVLIAYFIGRRRSRRLAYQSV